MATPLLGRDDGVTDAEPKPASDARADTDPWCTYAHIEVAGMQVAVTTEFVRQIVPKPAAMARLPRREGGLQGAFKLRGQVVPVVNLGTWLQLPGNTEPPHVMVLGAEGQVIGVAIDAIHGLLRLRASRVQPVLRDGEDDGFFHSVLSVTDDSELLSVLDPLRLMKNARAWANGGAPTPSDGLSTAVESRAYHPGDSASPITSQALVRLGSTALGVPYHHVREVLAQPPVQRVFGKDTAMLGMVRWRGLDVPLADPAKVLLLPLAPHPQGRRLILVLEHEGRHLAVPVDGVMAVRAFAAEDVQAAADTALAPAGTFVGSTTLEEGQRVLLLDSQQVLQAYGFKPLAQGNSGALQVSGASALEAERAATHARAQPHVVFDMGGEWAAPMEVLHEITPFPADFKPGTGSHGTITGTFEWRGKTLPVMDLRPAAGAAAATSTAALKLMVVQANGRMGALVVNEVLALLPAHQGVHTQVNMPGGEHMHLITVGEPPTRKSHRVLDVSGLPFFAP